MYIKENKLFFVKQKQGEYISPAFDTSMRMDVTFAEPIDADCSLKFVDRSTIDNSHS